MAKGPDWGAVFSVRAATPADAEGMMAILQGIAAQRLYTAITRPWSAAEQERHLTSLSRREVSHVAQTEQNRVIGYQTLELWAPTLDSMAHVGQVGTFLTPVWRGQGVGAALFRKTVDFARAHGYEKFVVQVRSGNTTGQAFYQRMGFHECGRLTRQVRIGEQEEDEVLMEFFL